MEIRDLQVFTSLAQHLHFARAARQCNLSPSALTRSIQKIERELDRELFLRDRRSVTLTPAGKLFIDYAERSLSEWERCRSQLNNRDETVRGELSIYSSVTAVYSILAKILTPFRHRFPEITIKLSTGDAADAQNRLLDRKAGCAIAVCPATLPQGLSFIHLITTPLICIAPMGNPAIPRFGRDGLIDWTETPMILSDRGELRDTLNGWFRQRSISPNIFAQVSGNEAIIAMVSLGFGIGVVPELVLQQSPMRDSVKTIATPPFKPYSVGILYPTKQETDPVIAAFHEIAREVYL